MNVSEHKDKDPFDHSGLSLNSPYIPGTTKLPVGSSVLVVLFGRIGDVIFTLPSILALKKARPDLRIDWLVEDRCADLLLNHPALRQVFLFRRGDYSRAVRERRFGSAWGIVRDLVRTVRREQYGAVLDFQGLLKSGVATFLARGRIKLGSPSTYGRMKEGAGLFSRQVPLSREGLHLVDRHLLVVRALLGQEVAAEPILLDFSEEERSHVRGLVGSDPYVLIHPFATWKTRNWSADSWARVAGDIARRGYRVVLAGAGGDAQRKVAEEIASGVPGGIVDFLGKGTLRELAFAMAASEAVLAVDSGPMHLAAATGTRVVALFGPTDPVRLGPYGPRRTAEGGETMGRSGMVVSAGLSCQPCMERRCSIGTLCQEQLTPEAVLEAFSEIMKSGTLAGQARLLREEGP